ncbi:universal stress protein [Aeromonas rivuli]|uniref:universal stress protein n=1 Tax=Aeromonas rivuli TaxID=648794 RepID=UPI0005AA9F88|nr:universal stress protein [Aeromonas rivuli]
MTHILACLDGVASQGAICDASAWAAAITGDAVTLLHVLERHQNVLPDLSGTIGLGSRETLQVELAELDQQRSQLARQQGKLQLDAAVHQLAEHGIQANRLQRHGDLLETLSEFAEQTRLLVLGKCGARHEGEDAVVGSQLESLLRTQRTPALVVQRHFTAPTSLLFAFDGSETAQRALLQLAGSTLLKGLPCHLVMVADPSAEHSAQLEDAAAMLRQGGWQVIPSLRQGELLPTLTQYLAQQQIALLVMGAYGHSRMRQFVLGSHTSAMLRALPCTLLLLR